MNPEDILIMYMCTVNKTSLKWLTVAMPLLETSRRQERDKTRVRLV